MCEGTGMCLPVHCSDPCYLSHVTILIKWVTLLVHRVFGFHASYPGLFPCRPLQSYRFFFKVVRSICPVCLWRSMCWGLIIHVNGDRLRCFNVVEYLYIHLSLWICMTMLDDPVIQSPLSVNPEENWAPISHTHACIHCWFCGRSGHKVKGPRPGLMD